MVKFVACQKPRNILLKENTVKITDFGIAIMTDEEERITATDERVGSKYYIAPELEEGRCEDIDQRADIFH
ncbi:MAG: protein kinase [Promethearchaeota archaeon]